MRILTANNRLVHNVKAGIAEVLSGSAIGLTVDSIDLGANAKIASAPLISKIHEDYTILGNHTQVHNRANEAEIPLIASGNANNLSASYRVTERFPYRVFVAGELMAPLPCIYSDRKLLTGFASAALAD